MKSARRVPAWFCGLLAVVGGSLAAGAAVARPPHHGPAPHQAAWPPAGAPVAEAAVQRLLVNPYGDVDGLLLNDGRVVRFPPHLGPQLAEVATPGRTVRVFGRPQALGQIKAYAVIDAASGASVIDQPPAWNERPLPRHLRAAQLQPLQTAGQVTTVLTGARGEINGAILDNGDIVRFPPHGLLQPLAVGQRLAASGLGTRSAHGTALEAVQLGPSLDALQPLYGGR